MYSFNRFLFIVKDSFLLQIIIQRFYFFSAFFLIPCSYTSAIYETVHVTVSAQYSPKV